MDRLRHVNAVLVEAMQAYLDYCRPNLEGEPILVRIREKMRAALRAATELPSVNWKDGKPYSYCPECGREEPMCPRPANVAPPGPLTVRECIARGECGCDEQPQRGECRMCRLLVEAMQSAPRPSSDATAAWLLSYIDWFFKTRGAALRAATEEAGMDQTESALQEAFDAWFARTQALTSEPLKPEDWTERWFDGYTPQEALEEGPE